MFGLVIALVLVWLGLAVVGTVVTGFFWLTLVAIAGILGTGAVGMSLRTARPLPDARPAGRPAEIRRITSAPGSPRRRAVQNSSEVKRAA